MSAWMWAMAAASFFASPGAWLARPAKQALGSTQYLMAPSGVPNVRVSRLFQLPARSKEKAMLHASSVMKRKGQEGEQEEQERAEEVCNS